MDEQTSWVADELPTLDAPHRGFEWPTDSPGLFDLDHDETATLYWARGRPSRLFLGDPPDSLTDELHRQIPMGYTTLATLEKVAVVADGRRLRIWPHGPRRTTAHDLQRYQLILPPLKDGYLKLGASWPFRFAVANAIDLSARAGGPVAVCRVLGHANWH